MLNDAGGVRAGEVCVFCFLWIKASVIHVEYMTGEKRGGVDAETEWLAKPEKEKDLVNAIKNYEKFIENSTDKNLSNNVQNKVNNLKKKLPEEVVE